MLYFLDLEFIERGPASPIDLISLGIVAEDGREFYAVSSEFDPNNASQWVVENVLNSLPPPPVDGNVARGCAFTGKHWKPKQDSSEATSQAWKTREQIAHDVLAFIGDDPAPIFWGEWCSYDWVVFCQLFGTMMDLPKGWPMRCRDVVQYCEDHLRLSTNDWPKSLETQGNHNALLGAKTVKARWEWCQEKELELRTERLGDGGVFRRFLP